jgi:hypothetical protein
MLKQLWLSKWETLELCCFVFSGFSCQKTDLNRDKTFDVDVRDE